MLYSKFPDEMKNTSKILEQIEETKTILSNPLFSRFEFIARYIESISFDKFASLNHIAQERNFKSIKNYLHTIQMKTNKSI